MRVCGSPVGQRGTQCQQQWNSVLGQGAVSPGLLPEASVDEKRQMVGCFFLSPLMH